MKYLLLPVLFIALGIFLTAETKYKVFGRILTTAAAVVLSAFLWFVSVLVLLLGNAGGDIYSVILPVFVVTALALFIGIIWGKGRKKQLLIPTVAIMMICVLSAGFTYCRQRYTDALPKVSENDSLLLEYAPYYSKTKVAEIDGEPTFKITDNNIPVMDGATALYPIYSAFAKAVYPKCATDSIVYEKSGKPYMNKNTYLRCNKTSGAYENIVTGDADIIFVAAPSDEQRKFAEEKGVELVYTPIGKEAFVFFVNSKNPIESLSTEQIKSIYSGKIRNWSKLGVNGFGRIKAFQRSEGSGSQTALENLMQGVKLAKAPKENVVETMGGILEKTADYRNFKNALGFSFRFYSAQMVKNKYIKLLDIDGVSPTVENIKNGTYPLTSQFYAVTRSDADENTKNLLEWLKSDQGKELIEKTGYTSLDR